MFIAMNRFKVVPSLSSEFEKVWTSRDTHLHEVPGFIEFHLLRGPVNETEGYTLFASHTVWASQDDFVACTKSENFRAAHRDAGTCKVHYLGHPQLIRRLFGRRRRLTAANARRPSRT